MNNPCTSILQYPIKLPLYGFEKCLEFFQVHLYNINTSFHLFCVHTMYEHATPILYLEGNRVSVVKKLKCVYV